MVISKKDRRHSGRVVEKIYHPNEFPEERTFWDDWRDRRDSFRDWFKDFKLIKKSQSKRWRERNEKREAMNKKQEMLLERRKARKIKGKSYNE